MSQNWMRAYKLSAGPAGGSGFEISQLKINFSLSKTEDETCNNITIQIWNLNEQHKAILDKKDCVVTLYAGYEGDIKHVFTGYVVFCTGEKDGADYRTELTVVDGRVECRDTTISKTYGGSTNSKNIFDDIATEMGIPVKYSDDVEHFDVDDYSFIGNATASLDEMCETGGLSWSIQDGELQIKKKFGVMNSTAYTLSSETGLIGCPKKVRLSSENSIDNDQYGYEVTFFMNADIKISDYVYLDSKKVKGYFRVSQISMSGSNLDGDWTCTATLLEDVRDTATVSADVLYKGSPEEVRKKVMKTAVGPSLSRELATVGVSTETTFTSTSPLRNNTLNQIITGG